MAGTSSSSSATARDDEVVSAGDRAQKGFPMVRIHPQDRDVEAVSDHADEGSSQNSSVPSAIPGSLRAEFERRPLFRRARNASRPVTNIGAKVLTWLRGPNPPQRRYIKPLFPKAQSLPVRLVEKVLPGTKRKIVALAVFYILWFSLFVALLQQWASSQSHNSSQAPLKLACASRLWTTTGTTATCGLDGENCRPFDNNTFGFCCPATCARQQVYNPYAIGAQEIIYRPLVIGGPVDDSDLFSYRGDSFICGAAVHAGVIDDGAGGCGIVSMTGSKNNFRGTARNGIDSLGFDATFPMSFTFLSESESGQNLAQVTDPRWRLLAMTVVFTSVFGLVTTSPALFFATIFTGIFWQVSLASNPPPGDSVAAVASTAISRFLPACFVAAVMFQISIKRTLTGLTAQVEKTVLWLGACWVGALGNYTLERIPIQRLTARDLSRQPGAIAALVIICLIIFGAVLLQAWYFRLEGRLIRYLGLYALFGVTLLLLISVPGVDLHVHHYIIGLLLLPGTSLQTRPSLVFQGLLLGLFIEGVARWDFAALLETPATLISDGQIGSLLPVLAAPLLQSSNITFTWDPPVDGYDGVSVLVNDVERFRGFAVDSVNSYTWQRQADNEPAYFRFGYVSYGRIQGIRFADYTKAGTWQPGQDGQWVEMAPGPSR